MILVKNCVPTVEGWLHVECLLVNAHFHFQSITFLDIIRRVSQLIPKHGFGLGLSHNTLIQPRSGPASSTVLLSAILNAVIGFTKAFSKPENSLFNFSVKRSVMQTLVAPLVFGHQQIEIWPCWGPGHGPLTRNANNADCTCVGNAGNIFPATNFKGNRQLAIPACITARASRTCRDACRDR